MALRDKIANKLLQSHTSALNWGDLVTVVQNLTASERDQLVQLLISDHQLAGKQLRSALIDLAKDRALNEADSMLADGALDANDINKIFNAV